MEIISEFFSKLYEFDALIRWGGYTVLTGIVFAETGLLIGCFLPGDSLLVTAGLMASGTEGLHIEWLIGLLSLAAIVGDSTGYMIGHRLGSRLFVREDSRFFKKSHLERTERFFKRYGAKTIILARFVPIVRTLAPTLAGAARMRYRTFLFFNVVGGVGWVASMTLSGYWLGRAIPNVEEHLHWVIAVVIILSCIPLVREWWQRHAAAKMTE
ncbi:MAG: VTT domain-containing protein [Candidatus Omnitrophica bacterium]|nr:VTT domain-containing protein [Candidatus Omnitrophota bacterium]MBI2174318.1 VTT domain-containing protein [Candidatus Omnitrophota bacterium]MBI3010567.1 VTT domain-containing protein [Candidatus Omnitrophota bacterium]